MKNFKRTMLYATLAVCVLGCVSVPFVMNGLSDNPGADIPTAQNINEESSETSETNEISSEDLSVEATMASIADEKKELTKDDVFYMMLNAQFNYGNVSGKIVDGEINIDKPYIVEFSANLVDGESYAKTTVSPVVLNNDYSDSVEANIVDEYDSEEYEESKERFFMDGEEITFDNIEKMKYVEKNLSGYKQADVLKIDDADRITEIDGEKCYGYVSNITIPGSARICVDPQEMAYGFLQDQSLWDFTGETEYLGRNCCIIEGKTEEYYGAKQNVEKFMFLVDSETGVLLKYVGYDSGGNLSDYMYAEEISFDYDSQKTDNLLKEKESCEYTLYEREEYFE